MTTSILKRFLARLAGAIHACPTVGASDSAPISRDMIPIDLSKRRGASF